MKNSRVLKVAAVAAVSLSVIFAPFASATTWKAGGASSVNGLMAACKTAYQAATGDDFPYNGTGSGAGKTGIQNGTMDFAFSDSVVTTELIANEIHLPAFVWPVAILTNLGGSNKPLTLSTETLAKIFAGKITRWNDSAIVAENNRASNVIIYKKKNGQIVKDAKGAPVVLRTQVVQNHRTLPDKAITVFYRSTNSGTTNNLARAFNNLYPEIWTKPAADGFATVFPGTLTSDPVHFRGAAGSGDVANGVKATPYSITYAEVGFAAAPYNLAITSVINKAGNAIVPSSDSAMAAAAKATVKDDGTVTFDYATKEAAAYPFTATTYALALTDYKDATKAAGIKKTLNYLSTNCAKDNPSLGFGAYSSTNAFAIAFQRQLAKLGK
jgi:phosphate transport system substrate-binding protein